MAVSSNAYDRLRKVSAVLLDMDGVLYVGDRALPGVQELLDYLDVTGRQWLFVTNNSSRTSQAFSDKLAAMNINVPPDKILGSAEATANWLAEQTGKGTRVIMMGEASLRAALAARVSISSTIRLMLKWPWQASTSASTMRSLSRMTLAIRNGARFVATNPDPTLPTERGQVPGTGSLVALLSAASGRSRSSWGNRIRACTNRQLNGLALGQRRR